MQTEQRFYITSLRTTPEHFNQIIRAHWSIENNLHWCLDVVFKEDYSTKRAGNAAENFSMINKAALSSLKNDKKNKSSLKRKRLKCGWSNEYLEHYCIKKIKCVCPARSVVISENNNFAIYFRISKPF